MRIGRTECAERYVESVEHLPDDSKGARGIPREREPEEVVGSTITELV
jgi:hypothetical protein